MTVHLAGDGTILLSGDCAVEEAETLLSLLLERPGAMVAWSGCRSAHGAIVQLLLALRPPLLGLPEDPFLRRWVAPLLDLRDAEPAGPEDTFG
jgi:hypothetical protein